MKKNNFLMNSLLFNVPPVPKTITGRKRRQNIKKASSDKDIKDELKKTHHTHPQYKDTIENKEKYIKILSEKSFNKLGDNLDIIREQMKYAFKKKKYAAYELLNEWERQNIIARLVKFDKEISKKKKL